jgi:hypothetical protein
LIQNISIIQSRKETKIKMKFPSTWYCPFFDFKVQLALTEGRTLEVINYLPRGVLGVWGWGGERRGPIVETHFETLSAALCYET